MSLTAYHTPQAVHTMGSIALQPDLFKIQKNIITASKELEKLKKETKNNFGAYGYQHRLSNFQQNIAEISKKIEKLEKEKLNIQNIQILQQPVTTELPLKKAKLKQKIMLATALGVFLMVFLAFLGEYISKYRNRRRF